MQIKNLNKKYNNKIILENINFEIETGHILSIIGPNGAGKTTLLKIITGLIKKYEGEVLINDNFVYLPENKSLYENYKISKIFKILQKYDNRFDINKAKQFLNIFELNDDKIINLSNGNRSILYNIIILSTNADLYILDEPVNNIDTIKRNMIFKFFRDLTFNNKSIIYTSHILTEVEKLADKTIILNKGKIIENSSIDDLKENYVAVVSNIPKGYFYKKAGNSNVYIVKKDQLKNEEYENISFDIIFEALIRGEHNV
jgi:ABC-2 type transport system ATP-binding protein